MTQHTVYDTPQACCRFGIARTDITPPVGIYHRMWGAAVHDRAAGVHRPLLATALAFGPLDDTRSETQLLLAIDHCLLGHAEMDALREAVTARTGLSREQLLVVFSHTHGAGLLGLDRVGFPGGDLIPAYFESLYDSLGRIAKEALAARQPASIRFGSGHCGLARPRDYLDDETGQYVCGFDPTGSADDTVLVARIERDGRTVATVVNYACHPTTLAWENQLISPDYPGAMRELVERQTDAPCVFLQGASGELGPRDSYVGDVDVADRNGRQLGYAALEVLESLLPGGMRMEYAGPVVSGATLGTWRRAALTPETRAAKSHWQIGRVAIDLPYRPELPTLDEVLAERDQLTREENEARAQGDLDRARDLRALVERKTRMAARLRSLPSGSVYPYLVNVWQLGDSIWIGLPGEPYNLIQTALRQRFPDKALVIMALADGWGPSYLPTRETYGKGIYQESIAVTSPGSLEQIIAEVVNWIALNSPSLAPTAARNSASTNS